MSAGPAWSRIAALALLGVVAAAVMRLAVLPLLAEGDAHAAAMAEDERLLARYREAAARVVREADRLQRLGADPGLAAALLPGEGDPGVQSAQLQTQIKDAAAAAGMAVISARALPEAAADGVRRVSVAVEMRGPWEAAVRLLHGLEAGRPMVRTDAIAIQAVTAGGSEVQVLADLYGLAVEAAP